MSGFFIEHLCCCGGVAFHRGRAPHCCTHSSVGNAGRMVTRVCGRQCQGEEGISQQKQRDRVTVRQVKSPTEMSASHTGTCSCPDCLLPPLVPVDAPGTAAEHGPSAWVPNVADTDVIQDPGYSLPQPWLSQPL